MTDFTQLLEAEVPRLRRYARALTRDASRADDLVQSCLVRAIAKQHLWQPGTDLRAWLFTILHNQHVNDVRRAVREGAAIPVEEVAPVLTVDSNAGASRAAAVQAAALSARRGASSSRISISTRRLSRPRDRRERTVPTGTSSTDATSS